MKKMLKTFGLLFLFFFAIACSHNEAAKIDDELILEGKVRLILKAEEKFSRTLFVDALEEMSYMLSGEEEYASESAPAFEKRWNSYSEMISDKEVFVERGFWSFTLTASKNGAPLYSATIFQYIDAGQNQLHFSLQEIKTEIENPKGDLSITFSFPDNADVKTVKAALLSVSDYMEIEGYEFEELGINSSSNSVVYSKNEIPEGIYIVKFCLYRTDGSEIAPGYRELVQIKHKRMTSANVAITETENYHTLTLKNLDFEGVEISGSTSLIFSELKNIDLLANKISRKGYMLAGWYDNENCEGKPITKVTAGEVTNDLVLWANWREEGYVYADEGDVLNSWLSSKEGEGPFDVFIMGEATSKQIAAIVFDANDKMPDKKINLDLTGTKNLTTIDNGAFSRGWNEGCSNLTKITIPDGVTSIGFRAFDGCTSLEEMTIPSVGCFGDYFAYQYIPESLKKVTVTSGEIVNSAFSDCSNIETIILSGDIKSIGSHAFSGCTGLKEITIPNSVTSIDSYAFSGCTSLAEMTIPFVGKGNNASYSYEKQFRYIFGSSSASSVPSSLKRVTVTGGEIFDGDYYYSAFADCSNIEAIILSGDIKSIGSYAFSGCTGLKEITIPDSVASIGSNAFYGCSKLADVYAETYEGWKSIAFSNELSNPLNANSNVKLHILNAGVGISVLLPPKNDVANLGWTHDGNTITITAESGHSNYVWLMDMQKQDETSNAIEIDATNMTQGLYSIMVIIDGIYSSTAAIRID